MGNLADNVRRFRARLKLSQLALMDRSGVTSVKQIESGEILSPHYDNLERLARALGVDVSDLYAKPRPPRAGRGRKTAGT
jgi:transcriptional regulator with XRE-family HTH domain